VKKEKMEKTKIAFRTGIVLVILAVFVLSAVPAVNAATAYFVPECSSKEPGDHSYMKLYVDVPAGETLLSWQAQIIFDPAYADITVVSKNCDQYADDTCFNTVSKNLSYTPNGYAWSFGYQPREWDPVEEEWVCPPAGWFVGPRTVKLARYKVVAEGTSGVSLVDYGFEQFPPGCAICLNSKLVNSNGLENSNVTWLSGTFMHQRTFSKNLVNGWNLISLPLTNCTMTVENIIDTSLHDSYDALYKYNTSTHSFESRSLTDTMENGVGYFINMTSPDTWTYSGGAYTAMNVSLSEGLNMIGGLNSSKQVSDILTDEDHWYATTFDANLQKYNDTCNPVAPSVFNRFTTLEPGAGYFISAKQGGWLNVSG
jgi:hypothetical protein